MVEWKYDKARDLALPAVDRYRSPLREGGLMESMARTIWWSSLRFSFTCLHRLSYHGREHLPARPPFVVVANHQSHLDALVIGAGIPLRFRDQLFPLAAGDVFFETLPLAAFSAIAMNALPVWRKKGGRHGLKALRERVLQDEGLFILFPEGTRSRTGELGAFRPGIGMLVAETDVPIVPCWIEGTFRAFPPQHYFPRPTKISVRFGKPFDCSQIVNRRKGWEQIAEQAATAVQALADSPGAPQPTASPR